MNLVSMLRTDPFSGRLDYVATMKRVTSSPLIRHFSEVLLLFGFLATSALAQEQRNFFPIFGGTAEGNSSSTIPFTGSSSSVRFQQVYDASGFINEGGNTPFLIRRLQFRTDGNGPGYFSQFPAFQINLSTTTRPVNGLSANFAENIGSDDAAVTQFGQFQISGEYVRVNNPQLFPQPSHGAKRNGVG